jgi:hypothetical protein
LVDTKVKVATWLFVSQATVAASVNAVYAAYPVPVNRLVPLSVVVLVAPDTLEPIAMAVVEPDKPAVPMLTVLVLPVLVAPDARPIVLAVVAEPKVFVPFENVLLLLNVCEALSAAKVTDVPGAGKV